MPSRVPFSILLFACAAAGCGDDSGPEVCAPTTPGCTDGGKPSDSSVPIPDAGADAGDGGAKDAGTTIPPGDGGGGDSAVRPPPQGEWKNATSNLANMDSECGNLTSLVAQPGADRLIAGVALKGLWSSTNGGQSWVALGTGTGSATIVNRPTCLLFDPAKPDQFWESGIYNGGGVYKTSDGGKAFSMLGVLSPSDAALSVDGVSVDFTDPDRKVLLAGGHERTQQVFRSGDSGATWTNVGAMLTKQCTWPLVLDASTYLVGCSYGDQGIYRSTDSGATWTLVSEAGGTNAPLVAKDRSIYWAIKDSAGLVRSTDDGKAWTKVTGPDVLNGVTPIELPDGRLAAIGRSTLLISSNAGATWEPVSTMLPYSDANGLAYSAAQKAFFIKHWTCGSGSVPVPPDAIMRYDFDYQKP